MNENVKKQLKKKIAESISKREAVDFLKALIRVPSEVGKPTYAQELVRMKLMEAGFSVESFPCEKESIENLVDFCSFEDNLKVTDEIYNLGAVKDGSDNERSLLLFSHIDTPARSEITPDFRVKEENGKLYGLGAADAKGGVAMMVLAACAVLREAPQLKNKLILLSTIGKRGSVGTLTAVTRGYHADGAVYLHPAETGHGFMEIKNYSMGALDFKVEIQGKPGIFRDEVDDSEVSAIAEGAKVIRVIGEWNRKRRKEHFFQEEAFAKLPDTKVNFLEAHSSCLEREDALKFEISCRMCFGLSESVPSVMEELKEYLKAAFAEDPWLSKHPPVVCRGEIRATPAYVPRSAELVRDVENNIKMVKQEEAFIYQYHASSDIRIPIVYGNTPAVGIGPLCGGLNEGGSPEWLDIADYVDGIRIAAGLIVDWCL